MKQYILLIMLLSIGTTSCITYGENTRSDYAALKDANCPDKAKELYLFMDNEQIDFEYEKLGILEVTGGQFSTLDEVLNELKYKAWENCANGILNISQSSTIRETGTAFLDNEENYSSKTMTGVAVRIKMDDEFQRQHIHNKSELLFVDQVEARKKDELRRANNEGTANVVAVIIGSIIVLIAAL